MSTDSSVADPRWALKKKCVDCIKGPNLIKTIIIAACVGISLQQITVCIQKLIDVPITTYTHFDFNETLLYPSVTFCREPSYKYNKMLEHGLYSHPQWTSMWMNFNFSKVSLDDLWDDITYTDKEVFVQYGLNGWADNVELSPTLGFALGRCYTMTPKILTSQVGKAAGYSITLKHTAVDVAYASGVNPPGYYIYLHDKKEPFTEVHVYNGGLVDAMYVNVGETLEVKLKVDEYAMISREGDLCTDEANYSANACTTKRVWKKVGNEAGCSGPWMDSHLPRCDNYTRMRDLISSYMSAYQNPESYGCPRICRSYLYNGYVMDRQKFYTWDTDAGQWYMRSSGDAALQTHLYIYFNSMMVSVYEERYNYDWNLFVSDLGGSVGFLLGLSVIGVISICSKTWSYLVEPFFKPKSKAGSVTSGDTADIETISKQQTIIENWHKRNNADN